MPDQVFVQVRFSQNTPQGVYSDALYFTQTDYSNLKQSDIEILKQQRVDAWVSSVLNAPPEKQLSDYTKDELIKLQTDILQQENDLQTKLVDINTEIGKK